MVAMLAVVAIISAAPPMVAPSAPELPHEYVDTTPVKSAGRTIHLSAGDNLQAALNAGNLGDVITLEPGATFTGPFTLPAKSGAGWLVIRTATPDSILSPHGIERVTPEMAPLMARLVAPSGAVMSLAPAAHHYRLIGLELSPAPATYLYHLIAPAREPVVDEDQPHHIIVERCYLHGDPVQGTRRAVALNGRHLAVIHSHLSDFKEAGADSQALAGWSGSGPIRIVDNYLEGSAENVLFGGADPTIPDLVPSDIEIRGNTFAKNPRWNPDGGRSDGSHWTAKNLFELKNARRVLIEGNLFEQYWGTAIVITPRNQNGRAPWSTVEDVVIRRNWLRQVWAVLLISGFDEYHPSRPTARIAFEDNLATDLLESGDPNPKTILMVNGPEDISVRHNTLLTTPKLRSSYLYLANSQVKKGSAFLFTDNIVHMGFYGLGATNPGLGPDAGSLLNGHFQSWSFERNVLINTRGLPTAVYPPTQLWASSLEAVGFRDLARGDFGLAPQSRYRRSPAEAGDPGVDFQALLAALGRYGVGDPRSARGAR